MPTKIHDRQHTENPPSRGPIFYTHEAPIQYTPHTGRSPSPPFSFCHAPPFVPVPSPRQRLTPAPGVIMNTNTQDQDTDRVHRAPQKFRNPPPLPSSFANACSKRQKDIASAPSCPGDGGGRGTMQSVQIQHQRVGRKKTLARGACAFWFCFALVGNCCYVLGDREGASEEQGSPPFGTAVLSLSLSPTRSGRGTAQSPARPAAAQ
jgi:hypothetical protein